MSNGITFKQFYNRLQDRDINQDGLITKTDENRAREEFNKVAGADQLLTQDEYVSICASLESKNIALSEPKNALISPKRGRRAANATARKVFKSKFGDKFLQMLPPKYRIEVLKMFKADSDADIDILDYLNRNIRDVRRQELSPQVRQDLKEATKARLKRDWYGEENYEKRLNAAEMSILCDHVYGDVYGRPPSIDLLTVKINGEDFGWQTVTDKQLKKLGLPDQFKLIDEESGFKSNLYYNEDTGKYAYVFAGTDAAKSKEDGDYKMTIVEMELSKKDQKNNVSQGAGLKSDQYKMAIDNSRMLIDALGKEKLQLAGHSLGGGLASAAGTIFDLPTTTFNASGIKGATLHWHYTDKDQHKSFEDAKDNVSAFYRQDEILSTMQDDMAILADAIGNRYMLTDDELGREKIGPLKLTAPDPDQSVPRHEDLTYFSKELGFEVDFKRSKI